MKRTILKQTEYVESLGCLPSAIVLCHIPDNVQPFVTWTRVINDDLRTSDFWGHYFNDIDGAVTDYNERASRLTGETQ
jgi:hypothetical protein